MVNLCSSSHAYRDLFFALATFFVATFTACAQGQEQERTAPPALPTQPLPQVPKPSIPPLAQAQELTNRGAYDEAAALYRQIIHSQPSAVAAYEGLAYSLLKNDQLRQAAQACSSGLRYDSTSVALYNLLSAAYAGQGRHALAISALERAVTQRPTYAQGLART